ncbi:MAG: hypothetical protein ACFFAH_15500 [Promethearchaeota archaeon]
MVSLSTKKKKKKKVEPEFNIKERFQNVKVLVDTNRPKEAIAYIYLVYCAVMDHKFKKPRLPYQTIREYAITVVNQLGQSPESTYSFVKHIEDIIYGGLEPTTNEINYTAKLFSTLYKEITKKNFSFSL